MSEQIRDFRFRDNTRAPFETEVKLRFDRFGGTVTAFSADISMEGVFVKTDDPKPVGTLVQFEFHLGEANDLIQGLGDVVWVRSEETAPNKPVGMGIQFRYIDPHSRDLIYRIVSQELEKRKPIAEEAATEVGGEDAADPGGQGVGAPEATGEAPTVAVPVRGDPPTATVTGWAEVLPSADFEVPLPESGGDSATGVDSVEPAAEILDPASSTSVEPGARVAPGSESAAIEDEGEVLGSLEELGPIDLRQPDPKTPTASTDVRAAEPTAEPHQASAKTEGLPNFFAESGLLDEPPPVIEKVKPLADSASIVGPSPKVPGLEGAPPETLKPGPLPPIPDANAVPFKVVETLGKTAQMPELSPGRASPAVAMGPAATSSRNPYKPPAPAAGLPDYLKPGDESRSRTGLWAALLILVGLVAGGYYFRGPILDWIESVRGGEETLVSQQNEPGSTPSSGGLVATNVSGAPDDGGASSGNTESGVTDSGDADFAASPSGLDGRQSVDEMTDALSGTAPSGTAPSVTLDPAVGVVDSGTETEGGTDLATMGDPAPEPASVEAARGREVGSTEGAGLPSRLTEVTARDIGGTTFLVIRADRPIRAGSYSFLELANPSRLLVKIQGVSEDYRGAVSSSRITALRTGLHGEAGSSEIHLVFDLARAGGMRTVEPAADGSLEVRLGSGN